MQKTRFFLFLMLFAPVGAVAQIASSEYVNQRLDTTVSVAGDQEISGTKNYTQSPIVPTPDLPTADADS